MVGRAWPVGHNGGGSEPHREIGGLWHADVRLPASLTEFGNEPLRRVLGLQIEPHDGTEAPGILNELSDIFVQGYAEEPYRFGPSELDIFRARLVDQCGQTGFSLVVARTASMAVGFSFGYTLSAHGAWWLNPLRPLPSELTEEDGSRTFAVLEFVVIPPWRRLGIGRALHDTLLAHRHEERATLTARPEAKAARAAYRRWGWHQVGQRRNPLPGRPIYDILMKELCR